MIKSIKFSTILMLLMGMTFMSCEKEENVTTVENYVNDAMTDIQEKSGCGNGGCFEFVFPIEITMPDGAIQNVDSYSEMREAFKIWREANPDVTGRPELVFPLDVLNKEGDLLTIDDKEAMKELLQTCPRRHKVRRGFYNECYHLVFPISLEMPNGDIITIENRSELKLFLRGSRGKFSKDRHPTLVFPLTVEFTDGTTQEVESKADLRIIKENCE